MLPALALAIVSIVPPQGELAFRQPQIAVDGVRVAVTFGSKEAIYFANSTDKGRTFSDAVKVASPKFFALGRHRGPRIAISDQGAVVSAVAGELGGGKDGDVIAWRSTDGGATWSDGVRVNDVVASAREGLHAMAAGKGGQVFAAWLDLRAKGTRIYGARSTDGGATWSKNVLVYESPSGTVCQCCHPSVAIDAAGNVAVMFRNALEGMRDMYAAKSTDGGRTFGAARKLGEGSWPLEACPMDGGGVGFDSDGRILSAWRRDAEVFFAPIGKPEAKLGIGKDPAVAASAAGTTVVWSEGKSLKVLPPNGSQAITLTESGSYVSLAGGGAVFAAWEEGERGIAVRRID
jgi:hypothetical protein